MSSSVCLTALSIPAAALPARLSVPLQAANHLCHLNIAPRRPYIHITRSRRGGEPIATNLPNTVSLPWLWLQISTQTHITSAKRQTSAKAAFLCWSWKRHRHAELCWDWHRCHDSSSVSELRLGKTWLRNNNNYGTQRSRDFFFFFLQGIHRPRSECQSAKVHRASSLNLTSAHPSGAPQETTNLMMPVCLPTRLHHTMQDFKLRAPPGVSLSHGYGPLWESGLPPENPHPHPRNCSTLIIITINWQKNISPDDRSRVKMVD